MHEPIRDDLDATIDRTVRAMLAVEPDATFDPRVRAVVTRRASFAWPRLAAAAACAVLTALILLGVGRWFGPTPRPDTPHIARGGSEATRTALPALALPDPTMASGAKPRVPASAADGDRRPAAARAPAQPQNARENARAAIAPDVNTVARGEPAVPITGAEPLPGVAPLPPIEPLTIASLPRDSPSPQARLIVPLEPIAAIEIAALSPSEWRE